MGVGVGVGQGDEAWGGLVLLLPSKCDSSQWRDSEEEETREIEWLQISGEKRNDQRRRMIPFFMERGFIGGVVPSHYVHLSSVSAQKDTV